VLDPPRESSGTCSSMAQMFPLLRVQQAEEAGTDGKRLRAGSFMADCGEDLRPTGRPRAALRNPRGNANQPSGSSSVPEVNIPCSAVVKASELIVVIHQEHTGDGPRLPSQ
jgi:hypothetical protein